MDAATTGNAPDVFISLAECRRRYGVTTPKIYRAAAGGLVRTQLTPGVPPRYLTSDIERLLRERLTEGTPLPKPGA